MKEVSVVSPNTRFMNQNKTQMADFHSYPVNASRKGDFNGGRDRIQTPTFSTTRKT